MDYTKHRVIFYSNVDVDYIKLDYLTNETIEDAMEHRDFLDLYTILKTRFDQSKIDALYFYPEAESGSTAPVFTIYRKTPSDSYYQYICTLSDGEYTVSDYKIESNGFYHYMVVVETITRNEEHEGSEPVSSYMIYENSDDYGNGTYYHRKFDSWIIQNIEESDEDNVYIKTGDTWRLGLNLGEQSITHNLGFTSQETLGKYPKISKSNKNYDSMSFTGLLGNIQDYTNYHFDTGEVNDYVYEEEDEEGNKIYIKSFTTTTGEDYTEKMDSYNSTTQTWGVFDPYAREVEKLERWKEFIADGELKLLRDMKGNSWVIQVVDSETYTIAQPSNIAQTQIQFNWVEITDISECSVVVIE